MRIVCAALLTCTFLYTAYTFESNPTSLDGKLIGGNPVNRSSFANYAVTIKLLGRTKCTALLISSKHVLTVAQCVYSVVIRLNKIIPIVKAYEVWIPSFSGKPEDIKLCHVKKIDINTGYKPKLPMNDIGLILLQEEVLLPPGSSFPKLAKSPVELKTKAEVIGFGPLYYRIENMPKIYTISVFKTFFVKLIEQLKCQKYFDKHYEISASDHVCALINVKIGYTNRKDLGSLLLQNDEIIGLQSFTSKKEEVVVYTSILAYSKYIEEAKKRLDGSFDPEAPTSKKRKRTEWLRSNRIFKKFN